MPRTPSEFSRPGLQQFLKEASSIKHLLLMLILDFGLEVQLTIPFYTDG
jgi:hypothetical protein